MILIRATDLLNRRLTDSGYQGHGTQQKLIEEDVENGQGESGMGGRDSKTLK